MTPDPRHDLIPRNTTLHLIDTLDATKDKLLDAAQEWELLDENGQVPPTASYTALLRHATDAHALSRDVLQLTTDFASSPHSTTLAGKPVLARLAQAATLSAQAAPHFSETAEGALSLPRSAHPADQHYLKNRMLINHASARACLRRASESLRDAAKELDVHLDVHRFFAPSPSQIPTPPQSGPSPHHR